MAKRLPAAPLTTAPSEPLPTAVRVPDPCTAAGTAGSRCRAAASSSWWVPDSRSSPLCSTRIWSMSWMVESRWAIGDRRPAAHQHLQRVADQQLGLGVDARRRLVEDQHARVERQRAGERQQLLLADRQRRAALGDRAREPVRQAVDEAAGVHRVGRAAHRLVVERRAQPDVARDRAGEQVHVLQHEAEQRRGAARGPCSRMSTPSTRIRPRLHVVEPQQQVDERRLARRRWRRRRRRAGPARPRTTRRCST